MFLKEVNMNKKEIFYDEINYIKDESLRKSLGKLIELLSSSKILFITNFL